MAPEMYEEHYDESVDVYAFGMCMLEMITGEYPYSECQFPAQIYKKVIQGIKPQCFEKIPVEYPEIREIIDRCTRLSRTERYTAKDLLIHDFFMPEELIGLRVEIKGRENAVCSTGNEVQMLLRVVDPKKRREYKQKENEAIQFTFDMQNDKPEEVSAQLALEEDSRTVVKLIQDKIIQLRKDRELYQNEQKRIKIEEEKHREEQQLQQELKELKEQKKEKKEKEAKSKLLRSFTWDICVVSEGIDGQKVPEPPTATIPTTAVATTDRCVSHSITVFECFVTVLA
ncbi:unnamed protein product [Soboliphyme baturini]|uniref:non-specific serine/threonine protein kinase n=1 Tax=Soboliphyme baturini TaxID=241478 RepID=A0A183J0K4_9BILA|nr:unnamed protein product [Soboliphyme baturini]